MGTADVLLGAMALGGETGRVSPVAPLAMRRRR
jgi:hypothetical protein